MNRVVVGVSRRAGTRGRAVRWAATGAALRGLRLTLVRVWDAQVERSVELDPAALPDVCGPVTARVGQPGSVVSALLAQQPARSWCSDGRWQRNTSRG